MSVKPGALQGWNHGRHPRDGSNDPRHKEFEKFGLGDLVLESWHLEPRTLTKPKSYQSQKAQQNISINPTHHVRPNPTQPLTMACLNPR